MRIPGEKTRKVHALLFTYTNSYSISVSSGHTMSELLETIQASEEELKQGLKHFECVEVDGMWFILDQDYQMMVLSRILKKVITKNNIVFLVNIYMYRYFDENSWKLDCVRKAETVSELASLVSDQVLAQVFDMFCEPMTGGEEDEYSLNKTRVSR